MPAPKDFVHTGDVVEAVLSVLRGDGTDHTNGLPASWFTGVGETKLVRLEHGDLMDYAGPSEVIDLCPSILVRGLGTRPLTGDAGDGHIQTTERIRILHIRAFNQCKTDTGEIETNQVKARERYAKIIGQALFADPYRMLAIIGSSRTEAALTCADDGGAAVLHAAFVQWDLGSGDGGAEEVSFIRQVGAAARVWAIACDIDVTVDTGGG